MPKPGRPAGVPNWRKKMQMNEVQALGQILDSSFGKSSSPTGTWSLKSSLAGDTLTVKYTTFVNFAGELGLNSQVPRFADEAAKRINAYMAEVKSSFREATGRSLKSKDVGGTDNIELIQSTAKSARKTAYYRFNRTFEIA
jgi:hypothetical protein